jgi:hypothetical protein
MSCTETNTTVEAAGAGSPETLLELLAPDRKPRLQSFRHAETNQEPHLPDRLAELLMRLEPEPATATQV